MHVQNSALVPPDHGARAVHAIKHAKLPPDLAKSAPGFSHQPPAIQPQPNAFTPAIQPSAPAPGPVEPGSSDPGLSSGSFLTLDELLERFGEKTDSQYDLNADGMVDILDLIKFLMDGGGSPIAAPVVEAVKAQRRETGDRANKGPNQVNVKMERKTDVFVAQISQFLHRAKSWGRQPTKTSLRTNDFGSDFALRIQNRRISPGGCQSGCFPVGDFHFYVYLATSPTSPTDRHASNPPQR